MKKNKLAYLGILFAFLCVFIAATTWVETKSLEAVSKYAKGSLLRFSQTESFQSEDFTIGIAADAALPKNAEIYYTLNGSIPTNQATLYTNPIPVTVADRVGATVIRAAVFYKGETSEIFTKTYFHAQNISQAGEFLLVSIVSDEHGLYDYDEGILVPGRLYDEFMQDAEKAANTPPWQIPANFKLLRGREHEKEAYVEMFIGQGEPVIAQAAGLTLSGGASSYMDVKSLKLAARKDYDPYNTKFRYDFYGIGRQTYAKLPLVRTYNRLVLRNGAQDRARSFIMWNVCSVLAADAGLPAVVPARPAVVFLNGEYYGTTQMQSTYSDYYLSKSFALPEDTIEIFESQEKSALSLAGMNPVMANDFSLAENAALLEQKMDMDDMLLYYAFEMCVHNSDWPNNNYKLWRYTGEPIPGNPYADGRLRPLLYDLDAAYIESKTDVFSLLLDEPAANISFLIRVLENEGFRNRFIHSINDLFASALTAENILEVFDREAENITALENDPVFGPEILADLPGGRTEKIAVIKDFAKGREEAVRTYIEAYFGLSVPYALHISAPAAGTIRWSTLSLGKGEENFTGRYYAETPLVLSAEIPEGFVFDAWLVNGDAVVEQDLTITEEMAASGKVSITLAVKKQDYGDKILINEFSAEGGRDWIELSNPYTTDISLKGLYLSDDSGNLFKSPLPDIVLEGGAVLTIHCDNNKVLSAYSCNFNLKTGETLTIANSGGVILDTVDVPQMHATESYGRLDGQNTFVFFTVPTPGKANLLP